jgi:hypothetical protein
MYHRGDKFPGFRTRRPQDSAKRHINRIEEEDENKDEEQPDKFLYWLEGAAEPICGCKRMNFPTN